MKHLLVVLLLLGFSAQAQERVNLTSAETKPNNAQYIVERIILNFDDPATAGIDEGSITLQIKGQNGEARTCIYNSTTSPTGTFLLNALNKADLSSVYASNATTGTLKQRIFHRLAVMNEGATVCGITLAGTIAGTVP